MHDGHGSTRTLADHNAAVTSHYGYEAYGLTQAGSTSAAETSVLYCGQQYDHTFKMYNLRARFYDPSNGRFNTRDKFKGYTDDPQSLHKYLYYNCDPVNAVDPSGHGILIAVLAIALILAILTIVYFAFRNTLPLASAVLYQPGMSGVPTYSTATTLLSGARRAMDDFNTPLATAYYDEYYSAGGEESRSIFFLQPGSKVSYLGTTAVKIKPKQVYLSDSWAGNGFTQQQRGLILLHEVRHSLNAVGDKTAWRATYIAEVRYRAAKNAMPLPLPRNNPGTFIFSESGYAEVEQYLPLADRIAIVQEINQTGRISDDTWN